jgi:hypothetical protein
MVEKKKEDNIQNTLVWICPKCGKKIESLYPNQLAFNTGVHKDVCKGDSKQ